MFCIFSLGFGLGEGAGLFVVAMYSWIHAPIMMPIDQVSEILCAKWWSCIMRLRRRC